MASLKQTAGAAGPAFRSGQNEEPAILYVRLGKPRTSRLAVLFVELEQSPEVGRCPSDAAPTKQVENDRDDREYEKNVDPGADGVHAGETQKPQHE
jgi:hypothetical protein